MTKDKTAPPAQPPAEAGVTVSAPTPSGLTYGQPEELGDGNIRLRASDGHGNTMTVIAASKEKAQAALRGAFKALTGEKES